MLKIKSSLALIFSILIQTNAHSEILLGVTTNNILIRFDSEAPGTVIDSVAITGLQGGENILGLDFRPANNSLVGIGSTSVVYVINTSTGAAVAAGAAFSPALAGSSFGVDFNPVVDKIRVVSDQDQNLRINPGGDNFATDGSLAYDAGDVNSAANPSIVAAAYTNSSASSTTTTLFAIDSALDILVRQGTANGTPTSPNPGTLFTIGALGVDTGTLVGLDVSPKKTGIAYASLTGNDNISKLYSVDLAGGAATLLGTIGNNAAISDISVLPAGTLDFSQSNYLVGEADGTATVTVERDGNSSGEISVLVTTTNGTATSGSDYTLTSTTLVFADGDRSKSLNVPVLNDTVSEANENITLTLSALTGGALLGGTGTALITIADNDAATIVAGPPILLVNVQNRVGPRRLYVPVGLRTQVSCSEACTVKGELSVTNAVKRRANLPDNKIGEGTATLSQVGKTALNITFSDAVRAALRNRSQQYTAILTVTATDADNTVTTETIRIAVKPD